MGLFSRYNKLEKELLEQYSQMLNVMGIPDARRMAEDLLNKAIEKSKEEGTYNLPPNFGNIILGKEKAELPVIEKVAEIFRKTLPQKKVDGVKNKDIKWWWNLNDVERSIMLGFDELNRGALFFEKVQSGMSHERAARTVWKFHPTYTYGDPSEKPDKAPSGLKKEDYKLPIELKDRINRYIEKRGKANPRKFKKDTENSSTFNALVRKEIKAGRL